MLISNESLRIIVVDDDPSARFVLRTLLKRMGHRVEVADSAAQCMEIVRAAKPDTYEVVVSDYWMPGGCGLDLLKQLLALDPTLGVLVATAEGEKSIVADVLRHGGCGYLDKPVSRAKLEEAVLRAAAHTRQQRHLRSAAAGASALGASQRTLLEHHTRQLGDSIELLFHSQAEASGDFVSVMPLPNDRLMILISDASGHDLRAAFQSNYFHGIARGLVAVGMRVEEVFNRFNQMLLGDWNTDGNINLSIAACGLMIGRGSGSLHSLNCGFPLPFISELDGFAYPLNATGNSHPLGWWEETLAPAYTPLPSGYLLAWTDGLPDVAQALDVDPLALTHRLLTDPASHEIFLTEAHDDLAAVRINLARYTGREAQPAIPLISRRLPGDSVNAIDDHQTWLERSLRVALPDISDTVLADTTICAREALLNALQHGCQGRPEHTADLQVSISTDTHQLHLRVSDSGSGHDFDLDQHEATAAALLLSEHRGLVMIKHLPTRIAAFSRGASLAMDFSL